jgi:hypothetical protein
MDELFGEVIFSYSRSQALEDGVLVDVSEMAREAGFKFPVAVTQRLHAEVLTPAPEGAANGQSFDGRLWDTLHMLHMAIKGAIPKRTYRSGMSQVTEYQCYFIMKARQRRLLTLKAVCGPGDDAEPVITLMLPDED